MVYQHHLWSTIIWLKEIIAEECVRGSPPEEHLTTPWLQELFEEETATTPGRSNCLSERPVSTSILSLRHCISESMQIANHLQALWILQWETGTMFGLKPQVSGREW